jgi:uncharacterized repeat protein (TIGR03806 family)
MFPRPFFTLASLHALTAFILATLAPLSAPAQPPPLTRVTASSLRLPLTAALQGYTTARAYPNLSFTQPVALVSPPGDTRRLFVVEKTGRIWVIPDVTAATRTLFLDLTARITGATSLGDERGLLALAFHPNYATNGQFYLWYTLTTTTSAGTGLHDRLARFRVSANDPQLADAASEEPLLTQRDEASNHNGGQLAFGPDGYLYLSIGDEGGGNDQFANAHRIDRDFFAAILRLDVDRRAGSLAPNPHPAIHAGTYAVPPDNPWVGATTFNGLAVTPSAVRTEFWATGLRNPWRFAFDSATGHLWCADVGQDSREEINVITRGGNYGWPYREASVTGPRANPPAAAVFTLPVWEYPRTQGLSITGGFVYRGNRHADLVGHYLFADYLSGRIWALTPDAANPASSVAADRVRQIAQDNSIVSFGLDPATGDILLADHAEGAIKRLVPDTATGGLALPATLSATGAFTNLATLTPAPGLIAYEPNVSFWSDHATKRRWFALTDATARIGFSPTANWSLPAGAIWVKHFDLALTRGDPATARRVETRFLVKTATGLYGATYRWNDAQTDATLVPDAGADATFTITDQAVTRPQSWRFPGRAECLTCHTDAGGLALSFNTRQLNRPHAFPGGTANQVTALALAGYLDATTSAAPPAPASLPALASADDLSAPLEARARSYLDANCSACHQPGGPALGTLDARARTPLSLAGLVHGPLLDSAGDPAHRVIVPGNPARSQLLARISTPGTRRMPPLATSERDLAGEALLTQWIAALAAPRAPARLVNLATRTSVLGGSATLISGFVIADAPKTVLVRAAGPALTAFGVPGALTEPGLALFRGTERIAANTRWPTAANAPELRATAQRVGAFAFAEGSADSALLATLAPGDYTAQVTSATSATGVALLELYDADPATPASASRLINTSVRAQVGTGGQILIPGLVIGPGAPKTLLVRAVGPGLAPFGVTGLLARPVLTLYAGDTAYRTNTGWRSLPDSAAFQLASERLNLFPLAENGADSGLFLTLDPGAYTLQVTGVGDSTGVALVEIYEVP